MQKYVTKLVLSQDDYTNLLEALQLYFKSPKVTDGNFDEVRFLYGHIKEAYGRRTQEEVVTPPKIAVREEVPVAAKKKVGVKKVAVIEVPAEEDEEKVQPHPFQASKKQSWICRACGKSRNSSYHKTVEGKFWVAKKD
jgi:hypothetical protein